MTTRLKAHAAFWLTLLLGVGADLLSKHLVFAWLSERAVSTAVLWAGVLQFSLRRNPGGPFSLLRGHNTLLAVFALLALGVVVYLYLGAARRGRMTGVLALALIAAGAVGNLHDRMRFDSVRDFIDFYRIGYPVFNVADILITMGALLLVIDLFRGRRQEASTPPRE